MLKTLILLPLLGFLSGGLILFFERKLIALAQKRLGISMLGRHGWVHLIADVVKFWSKGWNHFSWTTNWGILGQIGFLLVWTLFGLVFAMPTTSSFIDPWDFQILFYLAYASLSGIVFCFLILNSKSKYSIIAGVRVAIMNAFIELIFACLFLSIYIQLGSFILAVMATRGYTLLIFCPILALLFYIFILFESRRAPFDHTEAESELVAGHLMEYGGRALLCLFICEYLHLFLALFTFTLIILSGVYGWTNLFIFMLII